MGLGFGVWGYSTSLDALRCRIREALELGLRVGS